MITREEVAEKLRAYLEHRVELEDLVKWAEEAMERKDFEEDAFEAVRDAIARLGLADVRAFGLAWEDCEELLRRLGYRAKVEVHKSN